MAINKALLFRRFSPPNAAAAPSAVTVRAICAVVVVVRRRRRRRRYVRMDNGPCMYTHSLTRSFSHSPTSSAAAVV